MRGAPPAGCPPGGAPRDVSFLGPDGARFFDDMNLDGNVNRKFTIYLNAQNKYPLLCLL